jgi:tRNA threonylcarbamoyladenosine dehydratase
LNVIFAGDERGFLSVEPYATHPALAPFHGLVSEPPRARDEYPTPVDFMRALADWLGGWNRISSRSRDSLSRIGHDLCGYPQLASEARFAAGQLGFAARRLLLGEVLPPSWQHIDLDEILTSTAG